MMEEAKPTESTAKRRVPYLVLVGAGVLGLLMAVLGALLAWDADSGEYDPVGFEVAKAGIQVFAVGVLGGAAAWAWKVMSEHREAIAREERERHERAAVEEQKRREQVERKRQAELTAEQARRDQVNAQLFELFDMYNEVKQVRRIVRSLGLDLKAKDRPPAAGGGETRLTQEQVNGFTKQMLRLDTVQLKFEAKARQFGQTNVLNDDTTSVVKDLVTIEKHLRKTLEVAWEGRSWTIREGTEVKEISDALQPLLRKDEFRTGVSDPLYRLTAKINANLYGGATQATSEALSEIATQEA